MKWTDELHSSAALGGWPEDQVNAAEASITLLPDSDDWNAPGPFWTSAAQVVGRTIGGALPGVTQLIDTWIQRGLARGRNWTDTADDLWDGTRQATEAAVGEASQVTGLSTAATVGGEGLKAAGQGLSDAAGAYKKADTTIRWLGTGLLALGALFYFKRK